MRGPSVDDVLISHPSEEWENQRSAQEALWSATEVRTQAAQVTGQLDVWECIAATCDCDEPRAGRVSSPCPVHGEEQ